MIRAILITASVVLAFGGIRLARLAPIDAKMKNPLKILLGIGFFFMAFFLVVKNLDNANLWWAIPAVSFAVLIFICADRIRLINRLTEFDFKGTSMRDEEPEDTTQLDDDLYDDWPFSDEIDALLDDAAEPRPRRPFDNFEIADEADLGPQPLDMDHLDDYVFTSRHAYLVHVTDDGDSACDVLTITPGMSIADLLDAATGHHCQEKEDA